MKKLYLIFTLIFFSLNFTNAQNPFLPKIGQLFEQGYGDSLNECAYDLYVDNMGNKAMTGFLQIGEDNKDIAFWYIDSLGKLLWDTNYNFNMNEVAYAIAPHSTNGWVLVGYTEVYTDPPVRTGETRKEIFAMRIDTTGDTVWTFQYGRDNYNEVGYSVVNNGDDEFIIQGNSTPIGSGDAQIRVIKIGADGSGFEWNNLYGTTNYDIEGYKIINDYDNNYIIAANDVTDDINPKLYLIEDNIGRLLSTYDYDLNDDTKIFSIDTAFDKGYIVSGYGICDNDTDGFVMKLDTAFEQDWRKYIGKTGMESFNDIVTTDFTYIAVGRCNTRGEGYEDMYVVHIDSFGDTILHETFGGDSVDYGNAVARFTGMPLVYFAGYNTSYGIDSSGNAYLGVSLVTNNFDNTENCKIPRILWVDDFLSKSDIFSNQNILLNGEKRIKLISFAMQNNINYLILYGVSNIFNPAYVSSEEDRIYFEEKLAYFIDECNSYGIICGAAYGSPDDDQMTNQMGYNQNKYNFDHHGKINFLVLEDEYWNPDPDEEYSEYQEHGIYQGLYADHYVHLSKLINERTNDGNVDKVFECLNFTYHRSCEYDDQPQNHYLCTPHSDIDDWKEKQADIQESGSDALLVYHYIEHNDEDDDVAVSFLNSNHYPASRFKERLQYLGYRSDNKVTNIIPTFSCQTDYLQVWFNDSGNDFNRVETEYIDQHGYIYENLGNDYQYIDNVNISAFCYIYYSYLVDKMSQYPPYNELGFDDESLVDCPEFSDPISKILDIYKPNLYVYPNPLTNEITIKTNVTNNPFVRTLIKIYDISGKLIIAEVYINMETIRINTEAMKKGIYIIEISNDQYTLRRKLIKQ